MSELNKLLRRWLAATAVSLLTVVPLQANAVALSIDFDPGTAGVQSAFSSPVMPGDSFVVDVVISDVVNLLTFEFDLDFDPSALRATSVVSGGFLPNFVPVPPVPIFIPRVLEDDVTGPDVNFRETAFGPFGSTGTGVLASISFDALVAGTSMLTLNDVILLAPPPSGLITGVTLADGTATITASGPTLASAPTSGALVTISLLGLLLRRRTTQG